MPGMFARSTRTLHRSRRRWVRDGSLKYKEDVAEGIENAPSAFIGLLNGANFGKLVVKVC